MTKRLSDGVMFRDSGFIELSRLAQVVYLGMEKIADDYGNGRWTPQEVKGLLFARDKRATPGFLAKAMKEVEGLDDVAVYEKDGWRYFHLFRCSVERAKLRYHAESDVPPYPDTGKQATYLASLKVSSEISTEKAQSVGVGGGVGVRVGVFKGNEKEVDKGLTRVTKEEMIGLTHETKDDSNRFLQEDMTLPWAELGKLSAERQANVAREKKRRSALEGEEPPRKKYPDKEICRVAGCSQEELDHQRKIGTKEMMGMRIDL